MNESKGAERQRPLPPGNLPSPVPRSVRGGPEICRLSVSLEAVTPILGGSATPRSVDDIDIIRAPTIRGHLRFWWRALFGHQFHRSEDLWTRESEIWGRAGDERGGRAAVGLRVHVMACGSLDTADVDPQKTPGAYALWPARGEPPAPRRHAGSRFLLEVFSPKDLEDEVRSALKAWIVFGGYGSRTRRGLGSLAVTQEKDQWLPVTSTRDSLAKLFCRDVFAAPGREPGDTPWLAGACLEVGSPQERAEDAWTTALQWLQEFRQGCKGPAGKRAREPGTGKQQPQRPSISNWPEADKIRHLFKKTGSHKPRYGSKPAWPRAGFGLPIVGRFQTKGRDGGRLDEPPAFTLVWRVDKEEHDRLASPLIVKALPLADGTFLPCALWLNRAYPKGRVCLKNREGSDAPFDLLLAQGDLPYFDALRGKSSLREAFLDWLRDTKKTNRLAP